jgi:hypothetical protein
MSKRNKRRQHSDRAPAVLAFADLATTVSAVLVMSVALAVIGGTTGFRLLEGWRLVTVLALVSVLGAVAIVTVLRRTPASTVGPSRPAQWRPWGDHPVVIALLVLLGLGGLVVPLVTRDRSPAGVVTVLSPSVRITQLEASLSQEYDGLYVRIANRDRVAATGITLSLVTWRPGAPAADVRQDLPVHNLPPGDEVKLRVDLTPARFAKEPDMRSLYSGYFAVSAVESKAPQLWAFSIPPNSLSIASPEGRLPIAEFRADAERPFLHCVDVPTGICSAYGHSAGWTPK